MPATAQNFYKSKMADGVDIDLYADDLGEDFSQANVVKFVVVL